MKKGKITKKVVFHKKCPLFKIKCKRDECVFYSENQLLNDYEYIGKRPIGETRRHNSIETEFSVDGVKGFISGFCGFSKSGPESVRIHFTHIYKEREKITKTEYIAKLQPWWKFWKIALLGR